MPKSKNNPSEKKTVRGITTRVRTALENTARQLQLSADGLPIASGEKPINVIVAFSGGLDSSVLLYAVSQLKGKSYGEITAVHVHHGLSKHANEWAEFCEERAKKCGVRFVLRKVTVPSGGAGFEAEARQLRYEVLEGSGGRDLNGSSFRRSARNVPYSMDERLRSCGISRHASAASQRRMHDYASAARVSKDRTGTFCRNSRYQVGRR